MGNREYFNPNDYSKIEDLPSDKKQDFSKISEHNVLNVETDNRGRRKGYHEINEGFVGNEAIEEELIAGFAAAAENQTRYESLLAIKKDAYGDSFDPKDFILEKKDMVNATDVLKNEAQGIDELRNNILLKIKNSWSKEEAVSLVENNIELFCDDAKVMNLVMETEPSIALNESVLKLYEAASDRLKHDYDFTKKAVANCGEIIFSAPESLRLDRAIVLAAADNMRKFGRNPEQLFEKDEAIREKYKGDLEVLSKMTTLGTNYIKGYGGGSNINTLKSFMSEDLLAKIAAKRKNLK